MENLNAEQVKKALECCHSCNEADCKNCGYRQKAEGVEDLYISCTNILIADALALINSQEQRIGELEAENERLKAQKYYIHSDGRIEMIPTVESVRADTVRKMQQRLKECFDSEIEHMSIYTEGLVLFAVDQIAKEMLEVAKRREDIENSPVDCSTPSVTESQREADER